MEYESSRDSCNRTRSQLRVEMDSLWYEESDSGVRLHKSYGHGQGGLNSWCLDPSGQLRWPEPDTLWNWRSD